MKPIIKYIIVSLFLLLFSCDYYNNMIVKKEIYSGTIIQKFNDIEFHNERTFKIKTSNDTTYETANTFPDSWEYAEVGDSIIKMKGELYFTIKKKNGELKDFYLNP